MSPKRIIAAMQRNLARCLKVFQHLFEVKVDLRNYFKTNMKIDSYQDSGNDLLNLIFKAVWLINFIDMQEPVSVGPFWLFMKNRIYHFRFHLVVPVCTDDINEVGCKTGY